MRIHIKTDGRRINLIFPTAILLNRLTAHMIAGKSKIDVDSTPQLSGEQLNRLFTTIKQFKKSHPNFVLVEVRTHDGEEITVKL